MKDLASRYQLEPLTALASSGIEVARHLESLFRRDGAPLLLKRDNGSAFNHQAVNEVLARWGVIPLNSPACLAASHVFPCAQAYRLPIQVTSSFTRQDSKSQVPYIHIIAELA